MTMRSYPDSSKTFHLRIFALVFSICFLFISCEQDPTIGIRQTIEILKISPTVVAAGESITIEGGPFGTDPTAVQVFFNNKKGTLVARQFSNESIVVQIPSNASVGETFIRIEKAEEDPLQALRSIMVVNEASPSLSSQNKIREFSTTQIGSSVNNILSAAGLGGIGSSISSITSSITEDVSVHKIDYNINQNDELIGASAIVILPKNLASAEKKASIISIQHGTTTQSSQAPTQIFSAPGSILSPTGSATPNELTAIAAAAIATMGQIVVMTDYIGFGSSLSKVHPYLHADNLSVDGIHSLQACLNLLDQLGVRSNYDENVYLIGYSEGAYASIAMHRALEANPIQGLNIKFTSAGGGVYDLNAFRSYILSQIEYPQPYLLAYFLHAYSSLYTTINLQDIVQSPYHTSIPTLFNKTKASTDINNALTHNLFHLLQDDFRAGSSKNPKFKGFMDAIKENSLLNWGPQAPINFYHSKNDEVIPFINSKTAQSRLEQRAKEGTEITFSFLGNDDDDYDHITAAIPFFLSVIERINTDRGQ